MLSRKFKWLKLARNINVKSTLNKITQIKIKTEINQTLTILINTLIVYNLCKSTTEYMEC